ncbi:NAD(P)-dependent oxidoreductase [Falsiroseomonas sp.]|uniref:NAD(P)-dependent oxidoreductase n=1 Tax=Falsiroseomonas sp. TaxID=2870721 RepID=UPI003F70D21F
MTANRLRVFLTYTDDELANYYSETGLAGLREQADIVRNRTGRVLAGRELAEAVSGCPVIIAHRSAPGTADTFAHAPDLVAFLRGAVDISTIDVAAASAHGVLVTRATAGFSDSVAELGLGLMIDLARGVSRYRDVWRAGLAPVPVKGMQLRGSTVGIVGFGRIAQRLAGIAQGVGMQVLAFDPHNRPDAPGVTAASLTEVLAGADFVVCLAASTPETLQMFDAAAFAAMRRGAGFVNLSRGELVDEVALEAGHLRGAGLDVGMAPDQMPSPRLIARRDVVATPHVGGLTAQAREHQIQDTVRQVAALAAGRMPENAVNAAEATRWQTLQR